MSEHDPRSATARVHAGVVIVAALLAALTMTGCGVLPGLGRNGANDAAANAAREVAKQRQRAADAGAGDAGDQPAKPPTDAQQMADWVHREGQRFTSFTPSNDWQFVESQSGVDISSPIGDAIFSYAGAWGGPSMYSVEQVEQMGLQGAGFADITVLSRTPSASNPQRGQSRSTEFTGIRNGERWRGVMKVDTLAPNGMAAQMAISVEDKWPQFETILGLIQRHTTALGRSD